MSTNHLDYEWVLSAYKGIGSEIVVPCFGVHPWYTHLFSYDEDEDEPSLSKREHYEKVFQKEISDDSFLELLPNPIDFKDFFHKKLERFKEETNGGQLVIGEIGLDKLFKIPNTGYYGSKASIDGEVKLTSLRTPIGHQLKIFKYQLVFAFQNNLPVSVHCVKAMSFIIDIARSSYKDSESKILLHSYSGSLDSLKMLVKYTKKENVFVSVSSLLNKDRFDEIRTVVQHILIESDISVDRYQWQYDLLQDVSNRFDPEAFASYLCVGNK
jgi:Tat protein secretion system quality control protein TatD with DNase activity